MPSRLLACRDVVQPLLRGWQRQRAACCGCLPSDPGRCHQCQKSSPQTATESQLKIYLSQDITGNIMLKWRGLQYAPTPSICTLLPPTLPQACHGTVHMPAVHASLLYMAACDQQVA